MKLSSALSPLLPLLLTATLPLSQAFTPAVAASGSRLYSAWGVARGGDTSSSSKLGSAAVGNADWVKDIK